MRIDPRVSLYALILVAACSHEKEIRAIAEARRAAATRALDRYRAVATAARKAPAVAAPALVSEAVPMPDFTEYRGNVEIMHAEDLDDLGRRGAVPLRVRDMAPPNMVGQLLATGRWTGLDNPKIVNGFFDSLDERAFVLVLRTTAYVPARRAGESDLVPGRYEGQALLYRLADAAYIGGFPVRFASSSSVVLRVRKGPIRGMKLEEDFDKVMETDMWAEFRRQLHRGVRTLLPAAKPPYAEDVAAFGEERARGR